MGVRVELAGPAFDAVAHLLALVPVPPRAPTVTRAASLHDARYAAWSEILPEAATAPARQDAPVLGELLAGARGGERLQALLVLHGSPDELARGAALELGDAVATGPRWARAALAELAQDSEPLVELARCAAGLVARPYARAWELLMKPELLSVAPAVEAALGALARAAPCLEGLRVALSHPLGARGRGLDGTVAVGAPVRWCGGSAEDAAVRVLHERAVELASSALGEDGGGHDWGRTEWLALHAVSSLLEGSPLGAAHERFVAGLDPSGLVPVPGGAQRHLLARLRRPGSCPG